MLLAVGITPFNAVDARCYGDVDGDGLINITDILLIRDAIFGAELPEDDFAAADITRDGAINIDDILAVRDVIFGLRDPEAMPSAPTPTEQPTAPPTPEYFLTILATNDLHGHIDTLPEYFTIIKQIRAEEDNVLLLDAGDCFKRGPYEDFGGELEISMFNAMGYNAMVLGNNEFKVPNGGGLNNAGTLEESDAQITRIVEWAEFPVLCANARSMADNANILGTRDCVVEELGGLKVAVIGLTNTEAAGLDMGADKTFITPWRYYYDNLSDFQGKSDIQIVLSHAGSVQDGLIESAAAVIAGHDHFIYKNKTNKFGVPMTQAGGETEHWLARLDLGFAFIDGAWVVVEHSDRLYSAEGVEKDEDLWKIIEEFESKNLFSTE